jgi:tetratricopeptide (TPR) repeat protein
MTAKKIISVISILIFISLFLTSGKGYAGALEEAMEKGKDYISKGMYAEAIVEFTRVIDWDAKDAEAYYNRAQAYHKNKMIDKAILDYTKANENDPGNAEIYFNRGIAYYAQDFPDQAIADWDKAIELSPESADIYQKRAFAYFKKEKYDKSWEDVHKIEGLGYKVPPKFLEDLRKASGRDR